MTFASIKVYCLITLILTQIQVQVNIFSLNMRDIIVTFLDDGRSISRNFASLNMLAHDLVNLLCPLQSKPKYYHWFVDDIFKKKEKKDHVEKFLKYINFNHQSNKFTFEEVHNNKITFLDISITRIGNDELQTSLFEKKTFSGLYVTFNSHLPSECKKVLLHTLLHRANNNSSNYVNLQKIIF